jgi:beta-glucosidase
VVPDGAEIAQLYVAPPAGGAPRPPRELKGFARVELKAGASARVTIPVPRNAFAHWSSDGHAWTVAPGSYGLSIGASSRDLRLTHQIEVEGR